MPFITNDFNSMLVDDGDYKMYPEKYKYYVVARRLFVTSKEPLCINYLLERFNKYGSIESAKILQSKIEAFVTFKCDRHACLAYNFEKDMDPERRVMIDSTWHQPDEALRLVLESEWSDGRRRTNFLTDMKPPATLLRLDDDSFFSLFDRCDQLTLVNLSRTCKRLKQLLKCGSYYFPQQKKFNYPFPSDLPVNKVQGIFRLMGHCFDELDVWFDQHDSDVKIRAFIQLFVKYCSSGKIKKMTFGMYSWVNDTWNELRPILRNLTTLRVAIEDYKDEDIKVDFMEMCPNLSKLILWNVFIVAKCLTTNRPSLKSFWWKYSWVEFMNEIESLTFFENNPQITDFECREFDFEDLVKTLQMLPNIEALSLYEPPTNELEVEDVLSLKRFKNLTKLTLGMTDYYHSMDPWSVIDSCSKLKNLSELYLYFTKVEDKKMDKDRLTHISDTFHQLRHLTRLDLYAVQLTEELVFNFVLSVAKTKTIHLHECSVYATESLLKALGTIPNRRYLNGFRLFISDDKHNNLVIINDRKVVCVDWTCFHRFRHDD